MIENIPNSPSIYTQPDNSKIVKGKHQYEPESSSDFLDTLTNGIPKKKSNNEIQSNSDNENMERNKFNNPLNDSTKIDTSNNIQTNIYMSSIALNKQTYKTNILTIYKKEENRTAPHKNIETLNKSRITQIKNAEHTQKINTNKIYIHGNSNDIKSITKTKPENNIIKLHNVISSLPEKLKRKITLQKSYDKASLVIRDYVSNVNDILAIADDIHQHFIKNNIKNYQLIINGKEYRS
ncbi:hypothetical protein [Teredinibacter sp. KSP-S5-2]|uniref:hypothetical protein n=1 Tax=Teredinibacter sp. KSP-S5-2 TaxID=3034506 RepID=UPI0029348A19|nr:hypothetical protein [Teredinibacter sp. KSP-S5-2]WNO11335.1 hypothetical protein P5V12_09140 [Teredinibacter sp. KSP-S5-2]